MRVAITQLPEATYAVEAAIVLHVHRLSAGHAGEPVTSLAHGLTSLSSTITSAPRRVQTLGGEYNALKTGGGVIVEDERQTTQPDRASFDRLSQMIVGGRIAQVIAVTAELGLADLLKDGPCTVVDLAEATGTHAPSLHRLMRVLAALGLVTMDHETYLLTPLGAALRSDTTERLDLFARYTGHEVSWHTWGRLHHSIETGKAAFPAIFAMPSWEYQEHHPDFGRLFDAWMTAGTERRQDAILAAYDFSPFNTLVDIAGGHGQLLGAILRRYPAMHGVLFDQPHVVAGAAETLARLGVEDRWTTATGSFFDTVPGGGDAYMLKFILHDWDDDPVVTILQTVARAMAPGASLLVIDRVLPTDGVPAVKDALMDLHMLVLFAGKERTEPEFRSLYERAGFRLTRVVPTASDVSVIEGVRR